MSTAALPYQTDVTIDGFAPCCVAMTSDALAKVQASGVRYLSGGIIGSCDLNTQTAQFDDGLISYNVTQAQGANMARVLVMEPSATPSGEQQALCLSFV